MTDTTDAIDTVQYPKGYGPSPRPLLLRRRRDGSLALRGLNGSPSAEDRFFPPDHFFTNEWFRLFSGHYAMPTTDTITITLCNGEATYKLTDDPEDNRGIQGTLLSEDHWDPPPVDQERAEAIQVERRTNAVNAITDKYPSITPDDALGLLIDFGLLPANDISVEGEN